MNKRMVNKYLQQYIKYIEFIMLIDAIMEKLEFLKSSRNAFFYLKNIFGINYKKKYVVQWFLIRGAIQIKSDLEQFVPVKVVISISFQRKLH